MATTSSTTYIKPSFLLETISAFDTTTDLDADSTTDSTADSTTDSTSASTISTSASTDSTSVSTDSTITATYSTSYYYAVTISTKHIEVRFDTLTLTHISSSEAAYTIPVPTSSYDAAATTTPDVLLLQYMA